MRNQLPSCPVCGSRDVLPLYAPLAVAAPGRAATFTCNSSFCRRDGEFTV